MNFLFPPYFFTAKATAQRKIARAVQIIAIRTDRN